MLGKASTVLCYISRVASGSVDEDVMKVRLADYFGIGLPPPFTGYK
jgi:hypothetical protein